MTNEEEERIKELINSWESVWIIEEDNTEMLEKLECYEDIDERIIRRNEIIHELLTYYF